MKAIASFVSSCKLRQLLTDLVRKANEPQIISRKNHRGDVYFQVYDPQTKWTGNFSSEQEVRIWLDRRYYSKF